MWYINSFGSFSCSNLSFKRPLGVNQYDLEASETFATKISLGHHLGACRAYRGVRAGDEVEQSAVISGRIGATR